LPEIVRFEPTVFVIGDAVLIISLKGQYRNFHINKK
jgi:hypothetical protein